MPVCPSPACASQGVTTCSPCAAPTSSTPLRCSAIPCTVTTCSHSELSRGFQKIEKRASTGWLLQAVIARSCCRVWCTRYSSAWKLRRGACVWRLRKRDKSEFVCTIPKFTLRCLEPDKRRPNWPNTDWQASIYMRVL